MSPLPLASPVTKLSAKERKVTKEPAVSILGKSLGPLPSTPPVLRLDRVVVAADMLRTKTSVTPLASPATRLVASDWKATKLPLPLMLGLLLGPLPWAAALSTLTLVVVTAVTSRTKTSATPLVSAATRLLAMEVKAMRLPSSLMVDQKLLSSPAVPAVETLSLIVVIPPGSSKVPLPSESRSWRRRRGGWWCHQEPDCWRRR